ncbi:hypothetical protein LOTGIDRAFT_192388, partial [Lottia gigantea]
MNFTKALSYFIMRSNKQFIRNNVRNYGIAEERFQKTSFTFVSDETNDVIYIEKFNQLGFKLMNGFRVLGPAVFFPRSVLGWKVKNSTDINENSLSLFPLLAPKLDLLIVGIGDPGSQFDMNIIKYLRSNRISLEILPTEQAIPTFNFLNSERRNVAAALIPPVTL